MARGTRSYRTSLRLIAALLCVTLAQCTPTSDADTPPDYEDPDAVRYRLQLRENPVDPGEAFRCYGACQAQTTPEGYLGCLGECPGFDITPGVVCSRYDVPPRAACFTARRVPKGSEPEVGAVVIGVLAGVAMVVGLSALCTSSASQCGYGVNTLPLHPAQPAPQ